jgi:quinol monooxygenase YgiN
MIHVIAIITAKPGKRDQVLKLFKGIIPTVLAEDGCVEYGPVVDVANADPAFGPDTYVVVEKWRDMPALKAHAAAPHMKAFGGQAGDLIAKRAVHVMEGA